MPSPTTQRPIAGLLLVVTSSVGDHNKYLSNGCVVFGHSVNTELSILDDSAPQAKRSRRLTTSCGIRGDPISEESRNDLGIDQRVVYKHERRRMHRSL
jgi:hypothetical protein